MAMIDPNSEVQGDMTNSLTHKHFYRLSDPDSWEKRGNAYDGGGGIYVIRCLSSGASIESGSFIPVSRIFGSDPDGILYIGMAKDQGRLARLLESLDPRYNGKGHSDGKRYKADKRFEEHFPYADWVVELSGSKTPATTEAEYLNRYHSRHGELPPADRSKSKD